MGLSIIHTKINIMEQGLRFTMQISVTEIVTEIGMRIDRGYFTHTIIKTEIDEACFMWMILVLIQFVDIHDWKKSEWSQEYIQKRVEEATPETFLWFVAHYFRNKTFQHLISWSFL